MDLKVYYAKIRQIEAELSEPDVVVVSLETGDGGRRGIMTEVPRRIAARLLVEGKAALATQDEAEQHRKGLKELCRRAQDKAAAGKVQLAVVSDSQLRSYRSAKSQKD